jgi:putative oxidoreductase
VRREVSRAATAISWLLQAGLAAVFLFAGSRKLMADPMTVESFAKVGLGQWFRVLTGVLEVGGGIGLLIPRLAASAAAMLAVVMVGAAAAHLTVLGGTPALALAFLAGCLAIVWLRRHSLPLVGKA